MTAADLLQALALPPAAFDHAPRITKKAILLHAPLAPAQRRRLTVALREIHCPAILAPHTVAIAAAPGPPPPFAPVHDIAVLHAVLPPGTRSVPTLLALLHRVLPRPVLLLADHPPTCSLSAVHKRIAANNPNAPVPDGDPATATLANDADPAAAPPGLGLFLAALAHPHHPRTDLHAHYQSLIDAIHAYNAAQLTGQFTTAATPAKAQGRRDALAQLAALNHRATRLSAAARRERQTNRLVALNDQIQALHQQISSLTAQL